MDNIYYKALVLYIWLSTRVYISMCITKLGFDNSNSIIEGNDVDVVLRTLNSLIIVIIIGACIHVCTPVHVIISCIPMITY
jgi:hypothetical protein